MKLTRENYEMIMFDLLEGNLSKGEELKVMEQIESDEFYFSEWKLFKATVLLPDEEVVYKGKNELLKRDSVIPMRIWYSAAVAACLVIAFVVLRPKGVNPDSPVVVNPTPTKIETVIPQKQEVMINDSFNNQDKKELVLDGGAFPSINKIQSHKPEVVEIEENSKEKAQNNPALVDVVLNDSRKIEAIDTVKSPKLKLGPIEPEVIVDNQNPINNVDKPTEEKNWKSIVTSNPRQRIRNVVSQTVAALSNPKLDVKPNWSDKKVVIEFESKGYKALASLQPFKK